MTISLAAFAEDAGYARLIAQAYREPDDEVGHIEYILRPRAIVNAGTNEWRDWITNLRQYPKKVAGLGRVPAGYYSIANRQAFRLMVAASKKQIDLPNATLGGHSAGGAVIVLAAAELARHGIYVNRVVTFGAPDVGAVEALTRHVPVRQYVNGNDKVPSSTFYGEAVERTHIGLDEGYDHPINAYAEELDRLSRPQNSE